MGFFSALRRRPGEDDDLYDEYDEAYDEEEYEEDDYPESSYHADAYNRYENEAPRGGINPGPQPIHSMADMEVVLMKPQQYNDTRKIADCLRNMRFVVLNLAHTDRDIARRILDFVSGVAYAEDGHIMRVATDVYVAAPYFVKLQNNSGEARDFDSENFYS